MARVEVGGAARGNAIHPGLDRRYEVIYERRGVWLQDEHVVFDRAHDRCAAAVLERALGEINGPVRSRVAIERVDVALAVDDLRLAPGRPEVVGLGDPGVAD